MARKHIAVSETAGKLIVNKYLAKEYLDKEDYEKLIDIVDILKTCDRAVKGVLDFDDGKRNEGDYP